VYVYVCDEGREGKENSRIYIGGGVRRQKRYIWHGPLASHTYNQGGRGDCTYTHTHTRARARAADLRSLYTNVASMLRGYWIEYNIIIKYNNILLISAGSFRNFEYWSRGVKYYSLLSSSLFIWHDVYIILSKNTLFHKSRIVIVWLYVCIWFLNIHIHKHNTYIYYANARCEYKCITS
jgi:hypothetical protein